MVIATTHHAAGLAIIRLFECPTARDLVPSQDIPSEIPTWIWIATIATHMEKRYSMPDLPSGND